MYKHVLLLKTFERNLGLKLIYFSFYTLTRICDNILFLISKQLLSEEIVILASYTKVYNFALTEVYYLTNFNIF